MKLEMENAMTLDQIIKDLHQNIYNCIETDQSKDINLICKLLRYKYNNNELKNVSQNLIIEIEKRNKNPILWFSNN